MASSHMEIHNQIKEKVRDSRWRAVPYRNGGSATVTFGEIVTDSFDKVKESGRCASHCRLDDMYRPFPLGKLRMSKSYSALAPSNGIKWKDRFKSLTPDLRPFGPYKPKQGEWRSVKEKPVRPLAAHWGHPHRVGESMEPPLPPTTRKQYAVPADPTRFDNFALYWDGRARGIEYSEPFLNRPEDDCYAITEDRRYHRLPFAPNLVRRQPTCRHGRQLLLTAYC